jgi:aryl-alcohol dehydrogenase-like predicted oxidoreductase
VRKRPFGSTGEQVGELGLGTLTFGSETDETESRRIMDAFMAAGGTVVDTADTYGQGRSEEIIGRWLRGAPRNSVFLATKGRLPMPGCSSHGASRRHLAAALDASLTRLGTDHVDLYQVHWPDFETPDEETITVLDDAVRAGKTRYLGVSNYPAWKLARNLVLADTLGRARFAAVQPQYSLALRDIEAELLPLAKAEGLAVLPYSPLGGGVLTGKYSRGAQPPPGSRGERSAFLTRLDDRSLVIADFAAQVAARVGRTAPQVALNWLLRQPLVSAPILGVRTLGQLESNLAAAGWDLPDDQVSWLESHSRPYVPYPQRLYPAVLGRLP